MKKNSTIAVVVVVLIVLVGGGLALMHMSNKPKAAASVSTVSKTTTAVPAVNNAILVTKTDSNLGQYLATPDGQALYTFAGDTSGKSNCTGSCITNWPAYKATGATSGLPTGVATIMRSDNGQVQYTYNGMPLYTFVGDSNGQVTGNGVARFSVAKPAAASTTSTSSAAAKQPAAASAPTNTSSSSSSGW